MIKFLTKINIWNGCLTSMFPRHDSRKLGLLSTISWRFRSPITTQKFCVISFIIWASFSSKILKRLLDCKPLKDPLGLEKAKRPPSMILEQSQGWVVKKPEVLPGTVGIQEHQQNNLKLKMKPKRDLLKSLNKKEKMNKKAY
jgi:hypothetical protein